MGETVHQNATKSTYCPVKELGHTTYLAMMVLQQTLFVMYGCITRTLRQASHPKL